MYAECSIPSAETSRRLSSRNLFRTASDCSDVCGAETNKLYDGGNGERESSKIIAGRLVDHMEGKQKDVVSQASIKTASSCTVWTNHNA